MGEAGRSFTIGGTSVPAGPVAPGLYVVATPIGNLADITLRALNTLAAADLVACEDTRVTRVLMQRYGLGAPLLAYHEHNAERQRPRLLAALAEGKRVALVSDAGTPLVSDPGYRLVGAAIEAGFPVVPVPGASAVLAGLVAAGLPTDAFLFAGFLPAKGGPRRRRLAELAHVPATLVFFESPNRLGDSLGEMAELLGAGRPAAVARELTKLHETIVRGPLGELAARFAEPPKGEVVVVVAPPAEETASPADADALLAAALARMPASAAAADVARMTGLDRRELYRRALALKSPEAGRGDGG
jgi:16S rRNA (cytidine1402-2'-O)-methyltransferase